MRNLTLHNDDQKSENIGSKELKKLNNIMVNCPTVLAGMSHEVRTYMNAIVAFSYLMNRNGCDDSEREEFSNQILASCEQLIGLFDNFFDSAIIDTGNSKADFKVCKLNKFLDELLSEFRETLQKEAHKDVVLVAENSFPNQ